MLTRLSQSPPQTQTSRKQALSLPAPPMKKRQRCANNDEEENIIFKSLTASIFIPDLPESMAFDEEENNDKENPCPHVPSLKLQPKSGSMPKVCLGTISPFGSRRTTAFGKSSTRPYDHRMSSPMSTTMPSLVSLQQRRMNARDSDQQEVHLRLSALRF